MTGYLLAAAAAVAVVAVATAGVQSTRLATAHAVADRLTAERDRARADVAAAAHDRAVAVAALSWERLHAVAAERRASDLRERIARDAGTDRDALTAPVLRDAIQGLSRTAGDDAVSSEDWRLTVVRDGVTTDLGRWRRRAACVAAAMAVRDRLETVPVAERRPAEITCAAVEREWSA